MELDESDFVARWQLLVGQAEHRHHDAYIIWAGRHHGGQLNGRTTAGFTSAKAAS